MRRAHARCRGSCATSGLLPLPSPQQPQLPRPLRYAQGPAPHGGRGPATGRPARRPWLPAAARAGVRVRLRGKLSSLAACRPGCGTGEQQLRAKHRTRTHTHTQHAAQAGFGRLSNVTAPLPAAAASQNGNDAHTPHRTARTTVPAASTSTPQASARAVQAVYVSCVVVALASPGRAGSCPRPALTRSAARTHAFLPARLLHTHAGARAAAHRRGRRRR